MFLLNTTEPLTITLLLVATILLIFLGKETKKPAIPAIALMIYLLLLVIHTIQLCFTSYAEYFITIRFCIFFELVMIFVTFFAYLWVDDIYSKFYKKKSFDNSLDWFWKQV